MGTCALNKTLVMVSSLLRVRFSLWVPSDPLRPMSREEVFLCVRPGTQPLHPWQGTSLPLPRSLFGCKNFRHWRPPLADSCRRSWSWTFRPERLGCGWRRTATRRSRSSSPLLALRRKTTVKYTSIGQRAGIVLVMCISMSLSIYRLIIGVKTFDYLREEINILITPIYDLHVCLVLLNFLFVEEKPKRSDRKN